MVMVIPVTEREVLMKYKNYWTKVRKFVILSMEKDEKRNTHLRK